jgi:hypothetical protein
VDRYHAEASPITVKRRHPAPCPPAPSTATRAFDREEAWAPRYVAYDLADAEQRAEQARVDAEVWSARADAATDPTEAAQLRQAAEQALAEAADAARQAAALVLGAADDLRKMVHEVVQLDDARVLRRDPHGDPNVLRQRHGEPSEAG